MASVLSDALNTIVTEITEGSVSNIMKIDCWLSSLDDSDFNIVIDKVDTLDIVQDFIEGYMDFIEIEFDLTPSEYTSVIDNYKNLRCNLVFKTTDRETISEEEITSSYEYKFILKDKIDLFKNESESNLISTENSGEHEEHHARRIPVVAQLIDADTYEIRKRQLNFILRQQTVKGALHFIAGVLGIKKVHIVEPDNTKVYQNLIVPPMKNFSNIFLYLQNKYGIYDNGFTYYYTDEILYVYPAYLTDVESPYTVHVYQVGKGHMSGCDSYHIYKEDDIHLISNTGSTNSSNIDKGMENTGTAFMIQNGDGIIDGWRTMEEGNFNVPTTGVEVIGIDTEEGISTDTHHPQFKFSATNKQVHLSEIAKIDTTKMEFGWDHAIPFVIKPGYKLKYHYDGKDSEYTVVDGICSSVIYSIRPTDRLVERLYTCSSTMKIIV